jgi:thiamine pyrophosphokinase
MQALILADGDAPERRDLDLAWPGWDTEIGLVVAADGGARHAERLGCSIDVWVGDGDSVEPAMLESLAAQGIPIERSRPDKDESDTELAVLAGIRRGAQGVVIVGALGGPRIDHALANIGLLAMPALVGRPAALVDGRSRISLLRAPDPDGRPVTRTLVGRGGDRVSLLPLGPGVDGVTTAGLAYPLRDEPLPEGPARGLSNVRLAESASVTLQRGLLLIVESPARLPG